MNNVVNMAAERRQRAIDGLIDAAEKFAKADKEWRAFDPYPRNDPELDRLHDVRDRAESRLHEAAYTLSKIGCTR